MAPHLSDGAGRESLVDKAIMHKHVADAKDGDAEPSAKADTAELSRSQEAVSAEAHGRDSVDDGEDVIGLEGADPLLVVALV